ncbi:hypothetical protein ZIOFF_015458 [Zingiber officinale]|uniref:RNA helicase n=1 Tax=Zingiber officinale TaxID=94328 RepID=A0A8J5I1H3_ZINOF|nr:hypothetical protein ZIOFF_015458 [Zingiber officinale]
MGRTLDAAVAVVETMQSSRLDEGEKDLAKKSKTKNKREKSKVKESNSRALREDEIAAVDSPANGHNESVKNKKKKKRKAGDVEIEFDPPQEAEQDAQEEKINKVKKKRESEKGVHFRDETASKVNKERKQVEEEGGKKCVEVEQGPRVCGSAIVSGNNTSGAKYKALSSFSETGLPAQVLDCCKSFSKPSPIQSHSWPFLLDGRDLIGIAATGSGPVACHKGSRTMILRDVYGNVVGLLISTGKTLAFGVPALMHILRIKNGKESKRTVPRCLVLSPTRELAQQISDVLSDAGTPSGTKSVCLYGGTSKGPQIASLKSGVVVVRLVLKGKLGKMVEFECGGCGSWASSWNSLHVVIRSLANNRHSAVNCQVQEVILEVANDRFLVLMFLGFLIEDIVIGTPGRMKDLIEMGICQLKEVTFVVLDEADRMLDMGFEPEVRSILSQTSSTKWLHPFASSIPVSFFIMEWRSLHLVQSMVDLLSYDLDNLLLGNIKCCPHQQAEIAWMMAASIFAVCRNCSQTSVPLMLGRIIPALLRFPPFSFCCLFTDPLSARQMVMFSATWPFAVHQLAKEFMDPNPVKVVVGSEDLSANHDVMQIVEVLDDHSRDSRLVSLLEKYHQSQRNRVLVFVLYKKEAARVENMLQNNYYCYLLFSRGWKVVSVHGDKAQHDRTKSLCLFKEGTCPLMIATDVASRGLDIPDVEVVINYSFPLTTEDYVHRIGRTGRAGKKGVAHTFFTKENKGLAGELVNVLREAGQTVPVALTNFGTHVKKKESKLYGAHFKEITADAPKSTKITFSNSDDED